MSALLDQRLAPYFFGIAKPKEASRFRGLPARFPRIELSALSIAPICNRGQRFATRKIGKAHLRDGKLRYLVIPGARVLDGVFKERMFAPMAV